MLIDGAALLPVSAAVLSNGVAAAPATSTTVNDATALVLSVTVTPVSLFALAAYQISSSFSLPGARGVARIQVFDPVSVTLTTVAAGDALTRVLMVATRRSPAGVLPEASVAASVVPAAVLAAPKDLTVVAAAAWMVRRPTPKDDPSATSVMATAVPTAKPGDHRYRGMNRPLFANWSPRYRRPPRRPGG
jgi:hypothetical protein